MREEIVMASINYFKIGWVMMELTRPRGMKLWKMTSNIMTTYSETLIKGTQKEDKPPINNLQKRTTSIQRTN